MSYSVSECKHSMKSTEVNLCNSACSTLPINIWLGNHYYNHLALVAQRSKGGTEVTHLDAVTITVMLALVFSVSLTYVLFKECLHLPKGNDLM